MRPHLLLLSAFGPFPGVETVDLDALGAGGLLLLHGETGAGKTSVLDALGFALYGDVPGERGVKGLRSEHAAAADETWVQLEFSVGGDRYRVRRSPRQELPKQRGEGTTVRQPTGLLERRAADGWEPLSTRLDEIGDTVRDLVGLSAEQFFQVVLLPQGRFAAFLHAPAADRERLLRHLFGTERFARVEDELAARRRAAAEEVEALRRRAELEAVTLAGRLGADAAEVPEAGLAEWAAGLAVQLEAELALADDAVRQAQRRETEAAAAAEATAALADRQARRRRAEARAAALAGREADAGALREAVRRARAAAPLAADLERERVQETALSRLLVGRPAPQPDAAAEAALRERAAGVRALLPLAAQVAADAEALGALDRRLAAAAAAAEAARARHGKALERAQRAAQAELAAAEEAARAHTDAELAARSAWLDLRERRLAGMAAELAAGLAAGEPCTVCGSREHPAPARPGADAVTEADERAARAAAESAAGVVAEARSRLERARAAAAAPAGPEVAAAAEAVTVAAAEAEAVEQERVAAAAALAARQQQVDAARGDAPSLPVLAERLEAQAQALAGVRALAELRAELAGRLAAAGFADPAEARAALRTPQQLEADETALAELAAERLAVDALLADPELAVSLDPPADADAATDRLVAAREAHRQAVSAREQLVARRADCRAAAERLEALEAQLRPAEERLELVGRLAELAAGGGGNRLRMSLSSFVLAARLEAVAARASVRLATMTSGRYTLVHTDEVTDGRRRNGLGLAVRDVWTGGQRPTASLSGGETFMTALSLALGLADVVAEETGGRRLDTLFVDEGFGSLDEQALDRVMEVLDGLRDGGRLVGLVSHVAEMQRRAPARLEVLRGEGGSTLRAHPAPLLD